MKSSKRGVNFNQGFWQELGLKAFWQVVLLPIRIFDKIKSLRALEASRKSFASFRIAAKERLVSFLRANLFTVLLITSTLLIGAVSSTMAANAQLKANLKDREALVEQLETASKALRASEKLKSTSDSQLKQRAATEALLRAKIKKLTKQLQAKKAAEKAIGYGGNYAGPMSYGNSYAFGNCTYFVASVLLVPMNMGNANMWDDYAYIHGITVSASPIVGSVAQTDAGWYGHVAVVTGVSNEAVTVREMNVIGFNMIDEASYPLSNFKYIYFD